MQFLKDHTPGANLITGLEDTAVQVGEQVYRHSLIISATDLIENWPVQDVGMLSDQAWDEVIRTDPDLILLGTGPRLIFPKPEQLRRTMARGIGVEVMDTEAACRTYNLLVHEARKVTAALIFNQ